eukprot:723389-Pyramimonas_sp.AAC.1
MATVNLPIKLMLKPVAINTTYWVDEAGLVSGGCDEFTVSSLEFLASALFPTLGKQAPPPAGTEK